MSETVNNWLTKSNNTVKLTYKAQNKAVWGKFGIICLYSNWTSLSKSSLCFPKASFFFSTNCPNSPLLWTVHPECMLLTRHHNVLLLSSSLANIQQPYKRGSLGLQLAQAHVVDLSVVCRSEPLEVLNCEDKRLLGRFAFLHCTSE